MTCHAFTQGHALQSLRLTYTVPRHGVQSSGVQRSREHSACNPWQDAHEGRAGEGSGRAIPSRVVVEEEEASEHLPQDQHDDQYHEHQWRDP